MDEVDSMMRDADTSEILSKVKCSNPANVDLYYRGPDDPQLPFKCYEFAKTIQEKCGPGSSVTGFLPWINTGANGQFVFKLDILQFPIPKGDEALWGTRY